MSPQHYQRRILLMVTGLTTQVVTETLYALTQQQKPAFSPTEIHIITTGEGAQRIRLELLDAENGQFHAFCREYALPSSILFDESCLHTIRPPNGRTLEDIRTPEDNVYAADTISHRLQQLCNDANSALHVSIAGGRKSMGFFVGYCLSLFGREQDRLSHVLVNPPFESHREFFYPPLQDRVLYSHDGRPVSTADARIMLADIPFVRLRQGLPQSLLKGESSFSQSVDMAQHSIPNCNLTIDVEQHQLRCGNEVITLPPLKFAFYWWLAERRAQQLPPISWKNACIAEFLKYAESVQGRLSGHYEQTMAAVAEEGYFSKSFFEQKRSKVNRLLKKHLAPSVQDIFSIKTQGQRPNSVYGLLLPPEAISIHSPPTSDLPKGLTT